MNNQKHKNFIKKIAINIKDMVFVLLQALTLALIIRTFLFQPFSIPSSSMKPTLLPGDYLFVSKYAYGYSNYSFPFSLNIIKNRIFSSDPKRGDVSVFVHPKHPSTFYIKRIIGLPGDSIQMKNGILYINDVPIKRKKIKEIKDPKFFKDILFNNNSNDTISWYRETLPNNVSYNTFDILSNGIGDNTKVYKVPDFHYFVLGDNRDNSLDSRFDLGFIPMKNLIGRTNRVFFSIYSKNNTWKIWNWSYKIRWERLFKNIND